MPERRTLPKPEPLYPSYDKGKHQDYVVALKAVLTDDKSANIALSGPYGSGKSSILEGLLEDQNVGHLHPRSVSLATMGSRRAPDSTPGESGARAGDADFGPHLNAINLVQKEVCKQLLFSAPPKKFPMSRYFRPYRPTRRERLGWGCITVLPAMLIAALVVAALGLSKWWAGGLYVALSAMAVISTYLVWPRIAGRVLVSEVGAAGAKITLHREKTYFDEHLTELMYFFEVTRCRLVIFEDLDRFHSLPLIETLRDLNLTLNSDPSSGGGRIRFLYALGDELFESGEVRSKIFDTIVPVVPFASHSTSRGILAGKLRGERPPQGHPDAARFEQVERIISSHVHDHRLLMTIFNEFLVYQAKVAPTRAKDMLDSQLLAVVAYKCIIPSDYAKSQGLSSHMDKLNAAVVSDRITAERRCLDIRRNLTARERFLAPTSIQRANGLLKALGDPSTRDDMWWRLALERGSTWRHGSLTPQQISVLLAGGGSVQGMAEAMDHDQREAVREIDELHEEVRSASLDDLVEVIIPAVDGCIERYSVDLGASSSSWRSPTELGEAPALVQSLARSGALDSTFSAYVALANEGHLTVHGQSFVRAVIEARQPDPSHELSEEDATTILRDYTDDVMAEEWALHVSIADAVLGGGEPSSWRSYGDLLRRVAPESLRRFVEDYLQRGQDVKSFLEILAPTPWAVLAGLARRSEHARWLDRALQNGVNLDSKYPVEDELGWQASASTVGADDIAAGRKEVEVKDRIASNAHLLPSLTQEGVPEEATGCVVNSLSDLGVIVPSAVFTREATCMLTGVGILTVSERTLDSMSSHLDWDGTLTSEDLPDAMVKRVFDALIVYLTWTHKHRMPSVADSIGFPGTDELGVDAVEAITDVVSYPEEISITWGHLREMADTFTVQCIDIANTADANPINLANALLFRLISSSSEVVECILSDRLAKEHWAQGVENLDDVRAVITSGANHSYLLVDAVISGADSRVAFEAVEDAHLREVLSKEGADAALRRFFSSRQFGPTLGLELAIKAKRQDLIKAVLSESASSLPKASLRQALVELGGHFKDSITENARWPAEDSVLARALKACDGVRAASRRTGDRGYNVDATGLST